VPGVALTVADLEDYLASWELALRAERKSPQTVKAYGDGVRQFLTWAVDEGRSPDLTRPTVAAWVARLLDEGREPTTARARQLAVRRFSAWLAEEGEIPADELIGMRPPKIDAKLYHPLTDDQVRALIAACQGPAMFDRRDEALIRLMVETGARAGEVAAMQLSDVNLPAGTALIRRGKGGKGRTVPIGPQTVRAIDRYVRSRRAHRLAKTDALWLGDRGKTMGYDGLHKSLRARAAAAGVPGFHPHLLRHTAAHRWLAAGGSEGGLMAVAGWTRPDMLQRYTRARASERAAEEARKLNLGDL
jgi:site-specific recombinase XerD